MESLTSCVTARVCSGNNIVESTRVSIDERIKEAQRTLAV